MQQEGAERRARAYPRLFVDGDPDRSDSDADAENNLALFVDFASILTSYRRC